jgi:hypothetical protein
VSRLDRFTLGNNQAPIVLDDGWAPGPLWTGAENLASPGFDSPMVQYVATGNTDYSVPAHRYINIAKCSCSKIM